MTTAAVAAAMLALALDDGSAGVTGRSVAAMLAWWAVLLGVAFSFWPRGLIPRDGVACAALLTAFTVFAGLSALWAPAAERAFLEFDRAALHLGFFALAVGAARRGDASRWADGLAIAIALTGCVALAQRLLPGVFEPGDIPRLLPAAGTRLSEPVGYWNGLAILLALGLPLLLRTAASRAPLVFRALAVAPVPALAAASYLTSSRGGAAVAVVGAVVFLALTDRRLAALQALIVAAIGAALAIAVLRGHATLVDSPPGSPAAGDEGPGVAALVLLICAATGAVQALLAWLLPAHTRLPRGVAAVAAGFAVVAAAIALVAADPAERIRDFKEKPPAAAIDTSDDYVANHLLSGGGSGRWQFWEAAADQFREHPIAGQGGGSFESWWTQHGAIDWPIRNAHSLWLETLGELGLVGLLLLAGAFVAGAASGLRRLRQADRTAVAALLAVLVAFVVGAGIDWIWQLPAVAAVGVVALGLLVGPATTGGRSGAVVNPAAPATPRPTFAARTLLVLLACAAITAQAIPLLVARQLDASQDAAARGDFPAAQERAVSARSIQPWAASPRVQLALIREQVGDLAGARRHLSEAIERDPVDWRLRLVAARLATKDGDVAAARRQLREARRLNPRSPLVRRIS